MGNNVVVTAPTTCRGNEWYHKCSKELGTLAITTSALLFLGGTLLCPEGQISNNIMTENVSPQGILLEELKIPNSAVVDTIALTIDLKKIENINKIKQMSKLNNDWNGYDASAFSVIAIRNFEMIIQDLVKQPEIAPTGRNSLLLQYKFENGSLLAFEVGETKVEQVYIPQGNYSLVETSIYTEDMPRKIQECVEQVYGRE